MIFLNDHSNDHCVDCESQLRQLTEERDTARTCFALLLEAAKTYKIAHLTVRHTTLSVLPLDETSRSGATLRAVEMNRAAIVRLAAAQSVLFNVIDIIEE